ncbi:hypothetical protein ES332_D12G079100v1 [Gossypium tomentosum]|uniref:Uncharacterized protein n=1 Tax=Gossypium tomentosum TaxID=34277 RepID=A0A5D2I7Y5_GOSTO|nr:hypothetical protein ES332_D12G079100v1 [Gossypium tomentosum]
MVLLPFHYCEKKIQERNEKEKEIRNKLFSKAEKQQTQAGLNNRFNALENDEHCRFQGSPPTS